MSSSLTPTFVSLSHICAVVYRQGDKLARGVAEELPGQLKAAINSETPTIIGEVSIFDLKPHESVPLNSFIIIGVADRDVSSQRICAPFYRGQVTAPAGVSNATAGVVVRSGLRNAHCARQIVAWLAEQSAEKIAKLSNGLTPESKVFPWGPGPGAKYAKKEVPAVEAV